VVDESNANYRPPVFSAVNLVNDATNLIVFRGLSKAYGLGGLRLAYCVAPAALTQRIRSVMPPLLASSLSLRIGRAVLKLGGCGSAVAGEDRYRQGEDDGATQGSRDTRAGHLKPAAALHPGRNYPAYVRSRLESSGVRGKFHPYWSAAENDVRYIYRLSTPRSPGRMDQLQERIATVGRR
jgi:hypothetical protein